MNERIRELVEQAKEHANSYDDTGTPIWFQFYNEKFTELIVKECVENFTEVWYEQALDVRGAELGKFLKRFEEHLGVEK